MKKTMIVITMFLSLFLMVSCDDIFLPVEEKIDFNLRISNNILSWDYYDDATYHVLINDEEVFTTREPLYIINQFPITVQVKLESRDITSSYSKKVTFNENSYQAKNLYINYVDDSESIEPNVSLKSVPSYYYLVDSNYKLIDQSNYNLIESNILFNKDFVNKMEEDNDIYLITNEELFKIKFNVMDLFVPHIISPYIYTDFLEDVIIKFNLKGASLNISDERLPLNSYNIDGEELIINKEILYELFNDTERKSLILGVSLKLENIHHLSTIHIYKDY